jgi:hypothetical protein
MKMVYSKKRKCCSNLKKNPIKDTSKSLNSLARWPHRRPLHPAGIQFAWITLTYWKDDDANGTKEHWKNFQEPFS